MSTLSWRGDGRLQRISRHRRRHTPPRIGPDELAERMAAIAGLDLDRVQRSQPRCGSGKHSAAAGELGSAAG